MKNAPLQCSRAAGLIRRWFRFFSGENPGNARAKDHVSEPQAEGNRDALARLHLPRIDRGEADANENQDPEREKIHLLAQRDQPFLRVFRQKRRGIRGHRILQIDGAGRLQEKNQQKQNTAYSGNQKAVGDDAQGRREIRADSAEEAIRAPQDKRQDQDKYKRRRDTKNVREYRRVLRSDTRLLRLLFRGHLGRARTLLHLLGNVVLPIHSLVQGYANHYRQQRQQDHRSGPARLADNGLERRLRREENAEYAASRAQRWLRFRSRGYRRCCHCGLLHHGFHRANGFSCSYSTLWPRKDFSGGLLAQPAAGWAAMSQARRKRVTRERPQAARGYIRALAGAARLRQSPFPRTDHGA